MPQSPRYEAWYRTQFLVDSLLFFDAFGRLFPDEFYSAAAGVMPTKKKSLGQTAKNGKRICRKRYISIYRVKPVKESRKMTLLRWSQIPTISHSFIISDGCIHGKQLAIYSSSHLAILYLL